MLDIIICANFSVEKLRGLGNTRGQILEFPIEMAGHLYNSAALPRSLWYMVHNAFWVFYAANNLNVFALFVVTIKIIEVIIEHGVVNY